jgi:hypothetical protein
MYLSLIPFAIFSFIIASAADWTSIDNTVIHYYDNKNLTTFVVGLRAWSCRRLKLTTHTSSSTTACLITCVVCSVRLSGYQLLQIYLDIPLKTNTEERTISEKLMVTYLVKKSCSLHGTLFITVGSIAGQWSHSWAWWIQSKISYPISLILPLITFCHLHLDLPNVQFF